MGKRRGGGGRPPARQHRVGHRHQQLRLADGGQGPRPRRRPRPGDLGAHRRAGRGLGRRLLLRAQGRRRGARRARRRRPDRRLRRRRAVERPRPDTGQRRGLGPAKRIIRSGVTAGTGHEIEMDDTKQSVTITTSTKQKITMDPTKIELSNQAGTVKITLDDGGQSVSISAAASLKLEAPDISLKGATVEINGTGTTTIKSGKTCTVKAPMVKIN